jgi:hypothetical protein
MIMNGFISYMKTIRFLFVDLYVYLPVWFLLFETIHILQIIRFVY